MAVRIGKIELIGLQKIYTEDTRNLVQQRGPGQQGSVFQDLGREPVTLIMEGLLLGEDTQAALEELRQAQQKVKPLPLAADVIAGADLTEVLIADLRVRQLAGYANRFWFYLKVNEYTEPPEPKGAGVAAVNEEVAATADAWAEGGPAAAVGKSDPASLADTLQDNPAAIQHLTGGDVSGMIDAVGAKGGAGLLSKIGGAINTIRNLDPAILKELAAGAKDLYDAAMAAPEFLRKLDAVIESAKKVAVAMKAYDPAADFKKLKGLDGGTS